MLYKNTASQKIHIYAYDSTTGAAKTGDAGNITAYVSLDGTANAIDDTNPAEVDATNMPGVYAFDLTQVETNCNSFALYAKSSTSNIRIEPIIGFTTHSDVDAAMLEVATKQGYREGIDVIVPYAATPALRGTALLAAYATAKARTPYSAAISQTNQVNIYLPPWWYSLSDTLTLDTDYVNLIALFPEKGGSRRHSDADDESEGAIATFRPPQTVVYNNTNTNTTIIQSAQRVRCVGFAVAQLFFDGDGYTHGEATNCAYYVSANSNEGSRYKKMYFFHTCVANIRNPIGFIKHVSGIWEDCIANGFAWRIGIDEADDSQFYADMYNCEGGIFSFIGDTWTNRRGTHKALNSIFYRCKAIGVDAQHATYDSGYGAFGGCTGYGNHLESSCWFFECEAGSNSYGLTSTVAANFFRCIGGDNCFGGSVVNTAFTNYQGIFSGYAEDCVGGAHCFGGSYYLNTRNRLSGHIKNCVSKSSNFPWILSEGAIVENCCLSVGVTARDCLTLADSTCKISKSTILVVEGGTGIPINAASALSVCAVGNTYNNIGATGQVNGLGTNVTNVGNEAKTLTSLYDAAKTAASATNVSDLQTHGDTAWATATGFAVAGDEMTLSDIDGVDWEVALASILAHSVGVSEVTDNVVEYKRRDGLTTVATVTMGNTAGVRTTSVLVGE